MNVLLVDDQVPVVREICSGVDWEKIGIKEVYQAYSAFEARKILEKQQVDIMLCDIEMPVEDGLSLYRWVKERGLVEECIFLTAHADFDYAREAVRLGGFDYILQPARYEEIQDAVIRAENRICTRVEAQKYSSYGKAFSENRDIFLDGALRGVFFGKDENVPLVLERLRQMDICLESDQKIICVLLRFFFGQEQELEEALLRYASSNVLQELLAVFSYKTVLVQAEERQYGLLIYMENGHAPEEDLVMRQLSFFQQFCREQFHIGMAAYVGKAAPMGMQSAQNQILWHRMQDNVGEAEEICIPMYSEEDPEEDRELDHRIKRWGSMLLSGDALPVRDEIYEHLEGLRQSGKLNANLLKMFYQRFIQMFSVVAEQKNFSIQDILSSPEVLNDYLAAYQTVDGLYRLIDYVIPSFHRADPAENQKLIDSILQYIYSHIDEDIRRTEIAAEVFLNPDYLSRIFRKEMGVSLKEFITTEKMSIARDLLKSTQLPIGAIASRVGYANFSHFSQTYKKVMGMTPEEERKA